ncbi:MAG: DUF2931 family protein [Pseudomonas sp.]|nr:DUF2931 family protein [Pseudomonas sp.]
MRGSDPECCTLALLLGGCASGQGKPKLPYDAWNVGVFSPNYMEVWIESVDVIDQRGLVFEHVHGGVASITNPPDNRGNPVGWSKRPGGSTKGMPGIDLPEIIFVRWQSLVEPQTYNVRINIPEWVREEMLKPERAYCNWGGQWRDNQYRKDITIGLAPGGIAKAWVAGPCQEPIEIGRFEAAISKVGPYGGKSGGKHRPLSETSKAYIEAHGVPYGSW